MSNVVDGEILRQNFGELRRNAVQRCTIQPVVVRRGYVNASKGLVLMSKSALHAVQQQKQFAVTRATEKAFRDAELRDKDKMLRLKKRSACEAYDRLAFKQAYCALRCPK